VAGIRVVRVWTFVAANAGTVRRSLDYLSYMVSAIPAGLVQTRPDVVVGTSPQLLTVLAAWVVSRLKRVPCVFELRDLWPESMVAVGAASGGVPTRLLGRLSRFLYHRVDAIVAVTETFAGILSERGVPSDKVSVVRNGVDLGQFAPLSRNGPLRADLGIEDGRFLLTYVGTIGMAHGLSTLLDAAEAARGEPILFLLVGEGAERQTLERSAARRGLENVRFLGAVPRDRVPEILASSDAVLVHLKDDALFASVIPSKIFEAMATATPIILGVRGESADIVARAECGITVNPESPEEILDAVRRLRRDEPLARRLGGNGRLAAEREFSRREAAMRMLGVLSKVAGAERSGVLDCPRFPG
jgi:hypothetical protein